MRKLKYVPSGRRLWVALGLVALLSMGGWWMVRHAVPHAAAPTGAVVDAQRPTPARAGPPWVYGRAGARFTVIEYADLECPYCRAYFPTLKHWIDMHPEVNWQWQHLPLPMHEPTATAEARLAECAGETGGHTAFWKAVEWIYAHTRGDGQGVPDDQRYPGLTPAVARCLDSTTTEARIRTQAGEARRDGITAAPTLRLHDRETGRHLVLQGPVEGDVLLSAMDWLAAGNAAPAIASSPHAASAAPVGAPPR